MRKSYTATGITVSFDPALCIHAARCVRGLPTVFDAQARPWIRPGEAPPDAVAEVVRRCPTGALFYELDAGPAEEPDAVVTVTPAKDGPLFVRGRIDLTDPKANAVAVGPRFALCRCGGSGNKPFCDGTHRKIGFEG